MPRGFFAKVDQYDPSSWKQIQNFFVKKTQTTWTTINDAWVKVTPTTWKKFWTSATNPDTPIEILTSYSASELLRLQAVNYHWTPNPSSLAYKFTYTDGDNVSSVIDLTTSTTTTNPATGTSTTLPTSTTYRTISKTASPAEFTIGGISTYKVIITGTTSSGATSPQVAEYKMRTPLAPNVATNILTTTSVEITITPYSTEDGAVTGRYIIYTDDSVAGILETGGGRGGYAYSASKVVTLTGLTAGRAYDIYVAPFTGTTGSTTANATGYPGIEAVATVQTEAPYTFSFGNVLHVGTNGYISLDSGNSTDAISSTTGRVLGILPADLYQSTTTSIWYWSDAAQFRIRWEGYVFGNSAALRQYEVIFYKDQSYVTVYAINVTTGTPGTQAFLKDGVAKTSYPSALATGSAYNVSFDGSTAPITHIGYTPKSKTIMKQVTGLSSGSQDIGYTSITTSINQNLSVSAPTSMTATTDSSVRTRLEWSGGTASYYEFYYAASNSAVPTSTSVDFGADGTITTSPYDHAAPRGFDYYYFVRSVLGTTTTNTKSPWYPGIAPGIKGHRLLYAPPTPNTPTTSGVSGTNITVSWTAGTNGTTNDTATSYEIYTSTTNSAPSGSTSGTAATSPKSYTYTASASPSAQYFWVRGYNEGGYSAWSAAATATPTAVKPPNDPGTPTASDITNTSIKWTWTASSVDTTHSAAASYEYQIDSTSTAPTGGTWTSTSTNLTVTTSSLTKNTDYYLHVRARNTDGVSGIVNSAVAKTTNTASSFTVTFKANGGTGADYTQSASTSTALSANTFTRADTFVTPSFTGTLPGWTSSSNFQRTTGTGAYIRYGWNNGTQTWSGTINDYTFGSWNTAADGTGTSYAAGASYAFTADLVLYARWTAVRKGRGFNWELRSSTSTANSTNITDSSFKNYTTTQDTRATVQGTNFIYLLRSDGAAAQRDIIYSASPRNGRVQVYQFGTDGNEYDSSWTGFI
jgi:hypothetical protein